MGCGGDEAGPATEPLKSDGDESHGTCSEKQFQEPYVPSAESQNKFIRASRKRMIDRISEKPKEPLMIIVVVDASLLRFVVVLRTDHSCPQGVG